MTDQKQTQQTNQSQKTGDVDLKKKLEDAKKEAEKKDKQEETTEQSELEKTKQELTQMTELAKRTMADFQNFRRRQEEERKELILMGNTMLIKSLLPILENFERAKKHVPESAKEWYQGLEMSINQMHKILQEAGLKQMETIGQKFNPDLHEAVAQGPGEKDTITEEFEKGYILIDKVLQHAKVKVGTGEQK